MDDRIIELLYRNLQEVFGEGDAARRRAAIENFYTEDCALYVSPGVFVGRDALDKFAGDLRATHPWLDTHDVHHTGEIVSQYVHSRSACGCAGRGRGFKFRQTATLVPRGTVAGELGEGRFEYRGIVEAADVNGNDFRGHLRSSEKQATAVWTEMPDRLSTASAGDGADPGLTGHLELLFVDYHNR